MPDTLRGPLRGTPHPRDHRRHVHRAPPGQRPAAHPPHRRSGIRRQQRLARAGVLLGRQPRQRPQIQRLVPQLHRAGPHHDTRVLGHRGAVALQKLRQSQQTCPLRTLGGPGRTVVVRGTGPAPRPARPVKRIRVQQTQHMAGQRPVRRHRGLPRRIRQLPDAPGHPVRRQETIEILQHIAGHSHSLPLTAQTFNGTRPPHRPTTRGVPHTAGPGQPCPARTPCACHGRWGRVNTTTRPTRDQHGSC
ncbi:hypothetical protein SCATT_p17390 (plasmid) [Streptantibioticus cattleyicolor NRRL 8057 = DSM 46488]|uniref:Uncharacterized protein n=1 Tax=Streptantibioticus cattleyicolor (strain ATCC 35852 / DSM 46488 / JCM 4925 / NBRC 14057 / NRRL 8057) TaxID=1003195 RepID=G8XI24_STREN|nr:hypothetical protein SCATT_p17390 [Streptantibioticus cattleyicolor NRRL 8057 = DSM 46488]